MTKHPLHKTITCHPSFPPIEGGLGALYPVVDHVDWIAKLLPLGITTVQLRIKESNCSDLEEHIVEAIKLGRQYKAQVFINDYWKLALKHRAYGVHLGQEDLIDANLAELRSARMRLGVSTRTAQELQLALAINPSYLAIGHIFPTPTKVMPTQPQGIDQLREHVSVVAGNVPTVAIGGIDLSNAGIVWQTGVDSIAVVRAVTQADDLCQTLASFREQLSRIGQDVKGFVNVK